jgi:hypothetical protein
MYFDDHNPPHFHAIYGDAEAEFGIEPIALLGGGSRAAHERRFAALPVHRHGGQSWFQ